MRTTTFVRLVEEAIRLDTLEDVHRVNVPYDPKPGDPTVEVQSCIGFVLTEDVHMAKIAAKAIQILVSNWYEYSENDSDYMGDVIDEFAELMGGMRVAPYMQWHCAYFPHLTAEQLEAEQLEDAVYDPVDDVHTIVHAPGGTTTLDALQWYEILEHAGGSVIWYSGRGMMGRECVAITGTSDECRSTIVEATRRLAETACTDEAFARASVWHIDSLGLGEVYYFPQFEKPEGDDR